MITGIIVQTTSTIVIIGDPEISLLDIINKETPETKKRIIVIIAKE
jgi:hypothetical protein